MFVPNNISQRPQILFLQRQIYKDLQKFLKLLKNAPLIYFFKITVLTPIGIILVTVIFIIVY